VINMGFFNSAKTPNTVSDKDMDSLRRRAQKADTRSIFDPAVVRRRIASGAQQANADKS
jgi:hypothetical protein